MGRGSWKKSSMRKPFFSKVGILLGNFEGRHCLIFEHFIQLSVRAQHGGSRQPRLAVLVIVLAEIEKIHPKSPIAFFLSQYSTWLIICL